MLRHRQLSETGIEVSCLGPGGEWVLRSYGREREARAVIERALE